MRLLEYKWLRSLFNAMKLPFDAAARGELMEAYLRLIPFPEVKEALSALSCRSLAILSNGNPKILKQAAKNAGLEEAFSQVISVDEARSYKPSPEAYQLAAKTMRSEPDSIGEATAIC